MVDISARQVKELRDRTGVGMMDCKKALQETGGDLEEAVEYLREQGLAEASKKAGRVAAEGIVDAYVHIGGRVGVLLELNCETDFVARNDDFQELAHNIAMHIAAMGPEYVRRDDVPEQVVEREKEILRKQALESGKPEHVVDQIVKGRLDKFFEQVCLLEQAYVKDTDMTVEDLIKQAVVTLGENIRIRRFVRYEVGEGLERREEDLGDEVAAMLQEEEG
jgi:elongation factor Ts